MPSVWFPYLIPLCYWSDIWPLQKLETHCTLEWIENHSACKIHTKQERRWSAVLRNWEVRQEWWFKGECSRSWGFNHWGTPFHPARTGRESEFGNTFLPWQVSQRGRISMMLLFPVSPERKMGLRSEGDWKLFQTENARSSWYLDVKQFMIE